MDGIGKLFLGAMLLVTLGMGYASYMDGQVIAASVYFFTAIYMLRWLLDDIDPPESIQIEMGHRLPEEENNYNSQEHYTSQLTDLRQIRKD